MDDYIRDVLIAGISVAGVLLGVIAGYLLQERAADQRAMLAADGSMH